HPRAGVAQALAAGRRRVVGAAPDVHLLLAPLGARVVLVEARQVAIVALVERLVADGFEPALTDGGEDVVAGPLRADERRGEGNVELEAALGNEPPGPLRLLVPLFREIHVAPAGEQVPHVP